MVVEKVRLPVLLNVNIYKNSWIEIRSLLLNYISSQSGGRTRIFCMGSISNVKSLKTISFIYSLQAIIFYKR